MRTINNRRQKGRDDTAWMMWWIRKIQMYNWIRMLCVAFVRNSKWSEWLSADVWVSTLCRLALFIKCDRDEETRDSMRWVQCCQFFTEKTTLENKLHHNISHSCNNVDLIVIIKTLSSNGRKIIGFRNQMCGILKMYSNKCNYNFVYNKITNNVDCL